MTDSLNAAALGYAAGCVSTVALYPYRDYTKVFSIRPVTRVDFVQYSLVRYRGMLLNPSQPLLLSLPLGLLYGGFVLGSGGVAGAVCAGTLYGIGKVFVRTISCRFNTPCGRYNKVMYKSLFHCVLEVIRQCGFLSFFSGVSATALIATLWHGAALTQLQRYRNSGFFEAWWNAFRIHAFFTFATNAIRNTFRSALYSTKRAGGVHSLSSFVSGEVAVFREAGGVMLVMLRTMGLPFFFEGVLRTIFKSSVPFGFVFALFSLFGGSLSVHGGNGEKYGHQRRFYAPTRRFL